MALVPQVADAVVVPVIDAGGIATSEECRRPPSLHRARSGVQMGTAYLFCPKAEMCILPPAGGVLKRRGMIKPFVRTSSAVAPHAAIVQGSFANSGPMSEHAPLFN